MSKNGTKSVWYSNYKPYNASSSSYYDNQPSTFGEFTNRKDSTYFEECLKVIDDHGTAEEKAIAAWARTKY
jgi:hypothetical protein